MPLSSHTGNNQKESFEREKKSKTNLRQTLRLKNKERQIIIIIYYHITSYRQLPGTILATTPAQVFDPSQQ